MTASTRPSTPCMETYSPTRNGRVKIIVRPATKFPSTPCMASAMPAPATPRPAMSGRGCTPRFCSAINTNTNSTITRIMRVKSICNVVSNFSGRTARKKTFPIQRATRNPTIMITVAEMTLGPNSIRRSMPLFLMRCNVSICSFIIYLVFELGLKRAWELVSMSSSMLRGNYKAISQSKKVWQIL